MHWIMQSIHDFLAQPENNALSPGWSVPAFACIPCPEDLP
jgi:hypothetical protein